MRCTAFTFDAYVSVASFGLSGIDEARDIHGFASLLPLRPGRVNLAAVGEMAFVRAALHLAGYVAAEEEVASCES